ncbi:thioredoxin-like protein AAED1, chloroplastic isoform X2 [Syzygium oleosum]|uniref:thioredoxin-like protein AAED1, chloroplastic isoform X2 n=1 Tax=Syzygium oleosum TaxID=219896 RepID=UPI0024BB6CEA|nr:thioredoxin-like protein AAED1, chloroplastic isoform X2 [Syzygium oleosum]
MAASVGAALPCGPLQHHGRTADRAPALPIPRQPENRSLQAGRSLQSSRKHLGLSRRRSRVAASAGVGASAVGEDTGDSLDDVRVFDLSGNAVPISDLWKDRKAVIAFARHFGCVLCRKRADYLAAKKDIMDASGVALVLIGPGKVDQLLNSFCKSVSYAICLGNDAAKSPGLIVLVMPMPAKAFSEQTKFQGEVYADPSHSAYEALRFVSGFTTTFTPGAGLKIIQSYMEGYRQDWKLSSEKETVSRGGWQQGGIIVAGPGKNNISYIHKDKEAGDDPPIEEIMRACCS